MKINMNTLKKIVIKTFGYTIFCQNMETFQHLLVPVPVVKLDCVDSFMVVVW